MLCAGSWRVVVVQRGVGESLKQAMRSGQQISSIRGESTQGKAMVWVRHTICSEPRGGEKRGFILDGQRGSDRGCGCAASSSRSGRAGLVG